MRIKSSAVIILSFIAFISLALPDGLIGVAWPSMRNSFSRSLDSLGMILLSSTAGYLISSFSSGHLLARFGIGWLLSLSCGATSAALIGFTLIPSFWMIIPLAVLGGLGAGAIDAGLNTYAASHFSERLMQWLHASFGIGITIGPFIMTAGLNFFDSWRFGYLAVGTAQIFLAVCFAYTHSIWQNNPGQVIEEKNIKRVPLSETLVRVDVWLSILLFFVYSGIEASLGYWSYTLLTESREVPAALAGLWVSGYWGSFTAGRILAGVITKHFSMDTLIKWALIAAFIGIFLLAWNPFTLSSLFGVAITGFAIAPIFPGMVSLTHKRVSLIYTPNTVGMQIAAAGLGFSVLPSITGYIAQRTSIEAIPVIILLNIAVMFFLYTFVSRR